MVVVRWRLAILVLAACGRIGFGDRVATDGGGGSDADGDPAVACTFGPWGPATNLASLNTTASDWSPTLSDDGLELIFETTRSGNQDLYRAVRATTADPFDAPTPLTVLNTMQTEASPSLSRDRLTVYFSSSRSGQELLYRATRSDKDAPFGAPALVPELASMPLLGPAISASGDELFFTDISASSIARAVLIDGMFSVTGVASELGTTASAYPDLSRDGLTIYFDTNSSRLDSATRSAPGAPFSMPATVPETDSSAGEADAELGDGDRAMVFSSNRQGGAGGWDMWLTTRPCN
jgi:hypothetical protein